MLNANHPDDERLSALAAHDPDASDDETLTHHVSDCSRCADVVGELRGSEPRARGASRCCPEPASAPASGGCSRTLRRRRGWVKRLFGPVMAAGAALALVGMVGTVSPSLSGSMAAGGAEEHRVTATDSDAYARTSEAAAPAVGGESLGSGDGLQGEPPNEGEPDADNSSTSGDVTDVERSIWPMLLFTGVAVLIGAALLRWILVPRAA